MAAYWWHNSLCWTAKLRDSAAKRMKGSHNGRASFLQINLHVSGRNKRLLKGPPADLCKFIAISIHDLVPSRHKVSHELFFGIVLSVNLGEGAKLRV